MKKVGGGGVGEAGPRCTCVRVRVTSEFLTVHWEEIIREWVKPWVTPAGREGVQRGGRMREGSETERERSERRSRCEKSDGGGEGPARKTRLSF